MNYYTSDLHLCCQAALANPIIDFKFDNRPFNSLEEMQQTIIEKWNKKITNADHVYILGDLDRHNYNPEVVKILAQLKGSKHLIVGNHDDVRDLRLRQQFVEICDYKELTDNIDGQAYKLVLSHYPIFAWNGQHRKWIHLYGHVHNSYDEVAFKDAIKELNDFYKDRDKENYVPFNAYNVGCMRWNYEPVNLKEILEYKG